MECQIAHSNNYCYKLTERIKLLEEIAENSLTSLLQLSCQQMWLLFYQIVLINYKITCKLKTLWYQLSQSKLCHVVTV